MKIDYWKEYYNLKKLIESGKSREYKRLDTLLRLAEKQAEMIKVNWASIGILN